MTQLTLDFAAPAVTPITSATTETAPAVDAFRSSTSRKRRPAKARRPRQSTVAAAVDPLWGAAFCLLPEEEAAADELLKQWTRGDNQETKKEPSSETALLRSTPERQASMELSAQSDKSR